MAVDYGRYQLLKKIASGGMGQVFLARTSNTQGFDKLVVLKRILPQLVEDQEFIEMFFDEARIAARLNHPNLVQIFELSEAESTPYLAMEYVAGEDLRRLDKKARLCEMPLPVALALRIIADAAAGLDYAHKARDAQGKPLNLIHRDVSPQNILVGFDGAVKLIDFGVAKAAGRAQHTESGILKGKYPYMSPEQADGRDMDGRSDLFALGIVAWETLTGRRLFKGDSDLQTLRLVKECQVPPPSRFNPQVPAALDTIIMKALANQAADRFKDAGEFRLSLENFLIAHARAASSAHLSAFMQDLYKERIDRETDPSLLDELTPSANIEPGLTPSPRQSQTFPRWDVVPPPAQDAERENKTVSSRGKSREPADQQGGARKLSSGPRTQTLPVPIQGGKGKLIGGIVAAVVVISAGIAVPFLLPKSPPPVVEAPVKPPVIVETDVVVPNVNPETVDAAAQQVEVEVVTVPSGAEVLLDGKKLGTTPLKLSVPSDGSKVVAKLALDGYESSEELVSKASAPTVTYELKKKKGSVKVNTKKPPPPGIKTGR